MKKSVLKKTLVKNILSFVLLGSIFIGNSHGMEFARRATTAASLSYIGTQVSHNIHRERPINSVHCPLGIYQTLGLLSSISDKKSIQNEIRDFSNDSQIVHGLSDFNRLCENSSKREVSKFDFSNRAYALFAEHLKAKLGDELKDAGVQLMNVDFSNSQKAADKINALVSRDTREKIKKILSADDLDSGTLFVLLHTLYVNAGWDFCGVAEVRRNFSSIKDIKKEVKALKIDKTSLRFIQNETGETLVALPAVEGCQLTIRHHKDKENLEPVTMDHISRLSEQDEAFVNSFTAPYLRMTMDLDLKDLLKEQLPHVLQKPFITTLTPKSVSIGKYVQKLTFEMSNTGITASAATAMRLGVTSIRMPRSGPTIHVDSPFTFAFTREMEGTHFPLFLGQVVDHQVLSAE